MKTLMTMRLQKSINQKIDLIKEEIFFASILEYVFGFLSTEILFF